MWTREVAALRQELRVLVTDAVARMFVWTLTANTSALGKEDQVQTGDDDSNKGQRPVRRVEPFGVRSRPPAKQRSLSLRLGSSTVIYLGIASDGGYGPGDLEDGETAVYSKNVEKALHAMDSGDVALASKAGQVVSINGTDYFMAKWEPFATVLKICTQAIASSTIATDPATTLALANVIRAAFIALNTAMASNSNYKSAKAKNG